MGVNIIKVDEEYFTYIHFEPSSSGQTQSVDFNTVTGICITEFMNLARLDPNIRMEQYFQQFEKYIESKASLTIKFNKQVPYIMFSR